MMRLLPAAPVLLLAAALGLPAPAARAQMADDWSQYLGNFRAAIAACRARALDWDTVVTKGTPMNQGLVGLRLRTADGRRFDCIADQAAGTVQRLQPLGQDAADLPDEGKPVFVPRDQPQPRGACVRQVEETGGAVLGWLTYAATC